LLCDVTEYTMTVEVALEEATFQWYFNEGVIPGATGQSYTATESGTYGVQVFSGNCESYVDVNLLFSTSPELLQSPVEDFVCTEDGTHEFNLEDYNPQIAELSNGFAYYNSFIGADTESPLDEILNPTNYPVTVADGIITVYVRVENPDGCYSIAEIQLEVGQEPETAPAEYPECDDNGDGFAVFDLTAHGADLILSDPTGLNYEFFTDAAMTQLIADPTNFTNTVINTQVIYVRVFNPALGAKDCPTTEEMTLVVEEFPLIQAD